MDFTIVTPSFNYGHYIADCLQSVAEQDGVTYEHLVMDAGSMDNTAEVVAKFPHVQFFQEPDKGMSDGINKGFLKAKGDWVMWLNTDDQLLPGSLKKIKEWAEKHQDLDVVYGGWDFMDPEGKILRHLIPPAFDLNMLIHLGCYIGSTACFYRRSTVIDQGHLLNVNFKVVMDGEYYARLGRVGKRFGVLPEILARFRLHGENLSFRNTESRDIDRILGYQKQIAESIAIRRAYGWTFFQHPIANSIPDALLWGVYRIKKAFRKLSFSNRS
jgi:glycosyltransferase involved in cell wall biosynthesis